MISRIYIKILLFLLPLTAYAQTAQDWKAMERSIGVVLANDLGRNGYYDQKPIAETMAALCEQVDVECVVAPGDVHHFEGVRSVDDPLWMTNYEFIYSHPELMIPWHCTLGNHEYRGNTQACIDYTRKSARWNLPERYRTFVLDADDGTTLRFVLIDTTPLIDKYRAAKGKYPDAALQDRDRQLAWLDSVLSAAHEDWVLVAGHHPVYADTGKDNAERADMQKYVLPVLRRHADKVAMYLCGHIHNFQHIRPGAGDPIDYVVNTSASLARQKVSLIPGTVFASGESGFSFIAADRRSLTLYMLDKEGRTLHKVERTK